MDGAKAWGKTDKAISKLSEFSLYFSILALVIIMVLATVDVITTKFFNSPIPGTLSLIEDLNIPLVYMGMAYVQLERGHMAGPVFEKKFSPAANRAITLAGNILGIVICGLISWKTLPLLQELISGSVTKGGKVPFLLWPFAMVCFVSFALLTIAFILSSIRIMTKTKPDGMNIS